MKFYTYVWLVFKSGLYSRARYDGTPKVKFIYSEKATNFCEISTVDLPYVVTVKSTVEIFQNFVAFSEYMNFTCALCMHIPVYILKLTLRPLCNGPK
jgi:hypothetical protein